MRDMREAGRPSTEPRCARTNFFPALFPRSIFCLRLSSLKFLSIFFRCMQLTALQYATAQKALEELFQCCLCFEGFRIDR
jgi:hypothetical protein